MSCRVIKGVQCTTGLPLGVLIKENISELRQKGLSHEKMSRTDPGIYGTV
jgi:hypothetical protein